MSVTYQFIHIKDGLVAKPKDHDTRNLIRKHVMRDIGKARRRSKRNPQFELDVQPLEAPPVSSAGPLISTPDINTKVLSWIISRPVTLAPAAGSEDTASESSSNGSGSPEGGDSYALSRTPSRASMSETLDIRAGLALEPSDGQCLTTEDDGGHENDISQVNMKHSYSSIYDHAPRRMDPYAQYPVPLTTRMQHLIDYIHEDPTNSLRLFREAWLPLGTMDPAAFHQILSNAALHISRLHPQITQYAEDAAAFHVVAIRSVNERLQDTRSATTDGIMAAVTAFACHSHYLGDFNAWHMHMEGLKKMVSLRGGIDSPSLPTILKTVLFFVDVSGATSQDLRPYFPQPKTISTASSECLPTASGPWVPPSLPKVFQSSLRTQTESSIGSIIGSLWSVSEALDRTLAEDPRALWSDSTSIGHSIHSLLHDINSLSPTANGDVSAVLPLAEVMRLAAVLSLAESRRRLGIWPVWSYIHVAKLRDLLESFLSADNGRDPWTTNRSLKLWILMLGGMEATVEGHKAWFVGQLAQLARQMRLRPWSDARRVLLNAVWIDTVHSAGGLELWSGVEERLRS